MKRDLALVLADLAPAGDVGAAALVRGEPVETPAALDQAATLLRASVMPIIVGLGNLTIEAARQMTALAEQARARLLVPGSSAIAASQPVIQTATLGHARASDVVLWVGCDPAAARYPIVDAIGRGKQHRVVPATLEQVLRLREQGLSELLGPARTAAVILPHDADARLVSQWHKLAAQFQQAVRLAVLSVPWPLPLGNLRGAAEVVTWQTGLSPLNAGVDFADGMPRPCSARIPHGADLIIDAGLAWQAPRGVRRIAIGAADATAEVSLITPGAAAGLAAQVMRFDGIMLWLCDDPATAPPDPAVQLLQQLRQRMEDHS